MKCRSLFFILLVISPTALSEPYWDDWPILIAPPHEIREVVTVKVHANGDGLWLEAGDPLVEEMAAKAEAHGAAGTWCSDGFNCIQLFSLPSTWWPSMYEPVHVLEVKGPQVKFMTRERMFVGWVDERYLLPPASFKPLTEWKGTSEMVVCEDRGCHRITIDENGRFHWNHFRATNDECYFEIYDEENEDAYDSADEWETTCEIDGQIYRYRNYLRFHLDSGFFGWTRYFEVTEDGRLCLLNGLVEYGVCTPVHSKAYFEIGERQSTPRP